MLDAGSTSQIMMNYLINTITDKAKEKYDSYYEKKPRDPCKEFDRQVFFEFCKQQGACKNNYQRYD
jgi:hypothetical protein